MQPMSAEAWTQSLWGNASLPAPSFWEWQKGFWGMVERMAGAQLFDLWSPLKWDHSCSVASALLSGAWSPVPCEWKWEKRPLEVANTHSRLHAKYMLPHFMAIYRHASSHVLKFFSGFAFLHVTFILKVTEKRGRKEREDGEKKGGGLDESLESHKRELRETCLSPIQPPVVVVFFLDPSTGKKKSVSAHVHASLYLGAFFLCSELKQSDWIQSEFFACI